MKLSDWLKGFEKGLTDFPKSNRQPSFRNVVRIL